MELLQSLDGEGFIIYMDNFYTSPTLLQALYERGILAVGTLRTDRRGTPEAVRDGKQWGRVAVRGDMRWVRDGNILYTQWKDSKAVTVASTVHSALDHGTAKRRIKEGGNWSRKEIRRPKCIEDYNQYMNGVDKSDQLISRYCVLIKSWRWWKTLFFHLIDMACVNSYIIFKAMQALFPDNPMLQRPNSYGQLEFREEIVRGLAGIVENEEPPKYAKRKSYSFSPKQFETDHIPERSMHRNCKVCYFKCNVEKKTSVYCSADQCNVPLCFTPDRNCFKIWHDPKYQGRK